MSRGRFIFWLDYSKDDELLLAETIDELKTQRSFVGTIRDGIRLICDLRAGRLEVLFDLFPWVKAEFLAGIQPRETAGERHLREHLIRIEQQLKEQGNTVISHASEAPRQLGAGNGSLPGGPKKLNAPALTAPTFDDDDDDILTVKRDTSTHSARNFIEATLGLQQ